MKGKWEIVAGCDCKGAVWMGDSTFLGKMWGVWVVKHRICTEQVGSEFDLSICCIRDRAPGHNVPWSAHGAVGPQPVHIPVCAPLRDLFQSRERHQDCFVAVLWDISL